MEDKKKEVWVLISHSYNMDGRASSQTITDKIPFLKEAGIEPVIISGTSGYRDSELEHYQLWPWAPSGWRFDMRHWMKMRIKNPVILRLVKGLFAILILPFYLIERVLFPMETHWSWAFPAALKAIRMVRKHDARIIMAVGSANSAFLGGFLASKWTGKPWIAEVHDPMLYEGIPGSWLKTKWAGWMETLICRKASHAWWFTQNALDRARARNPELGDKGFLVLPGAEEPDYGDSNYHRGEALTFGHFGGLAPTRNLSVFLVALGKWLRINPQYRKKVECHVYGSSLDQVSRETIARENLEDRVTVHGRLEYDVETGKSGRQRVLEIMRSTGVLILLHGVGRFCEEYVPSKFYEYQWTRRPIFAFVRDHVMMEELVAEMGGRSVSADGVDDAMNQIDLLFKEWEDEGLSDRPLGEKHSTRKAVRRILEQVGRS